MWRWLPPRAQLRNSRAISTSWLLLTQVLSLRRAAVRPVLANEAPSSGTSRKRVVVSRCPPMSTPFEPRGAATSIQRTSESRGYGLRTSACRLIRKERKIARSLHTCIDVLHRPLRVVEGEGDLEEAHCRAGCGLSSCLRRDCWGRYTATGPSQCWAIREQLRGELGHEHRSDDAANELLRA